MENNNNRYGASPGEAPNVTIMREMHRRQTEYAPGGDFGAEEERFYPMPVREAYPPSVQRVPDSRVPRTGKRRKKHRLLKLLILIPLILLLLLAAAAAIIWFSAKCPAQNDNIGTRKNNCTTVLIAGTDVSGTNTDVLMVAYFNRVEKAVRLLSIPRDTMVNRTSPVPKINGAYYANGAGETGMGYLMDYVKDVIGYRPDAYLMIDLSCFESLVDEMGGVTFDVPIDMYYNDPSQDLYIDLKAGTHKLTGEEAMWLVRFRSAYACGDLDRVDVQKEFIRTAASQWVNLKNLGKLPKALKLLKNNAMTNLSDANMTWLAFSLAVCARGDFASATLPGDEVWAGESRGVYYGSYYEEKTAEAADLVNRLFNPYDKEISADDLHPFGK